MADDTDNRVFTARHVEEVAGLSRRQQNDWDERGALPSQRDSEEGWRRYTLREIFCLATMGEIRRKFGVPVERLRFVREMMLQEGADHLKAAAELMIILGVGVWLLTDLESTFIMDSELEFEDLWAMGFFSGETNSSYLLINLTPIVRKLFATGDEPITFEMHGKGREILFQTMRPNVSAEEAELLKLIRSGSFDRVEVTATDGSIQTIRTTTVMDVASQIEDLINQQDYQTLTVVVSEGNIRRVSQEATIKPGIKKSKKK